MNFLSIIFTLLAVGIFFVGLLINYFTYLVPEFCVKLFRFGRANISKNSGVLKNIEVPKSWFGHFYLYAVIFQATVIYTVINKYKNLDTSSNWLSEILSFVAGPDRSTTVNSTTTVLVIFLFLFHLSRRLLETWYVSIYSGTKMNILHYVIAFVHYTGAILSLIAHSPGFSSAFSLSEDFLIDVKHFTLIQFVGTSLFLYGNYQQYHVHKSYADLRRGRESAVTTLEHKIPRGGLFEKVSCPNYWAEILIYISFTIILGFQNDTWNRCNIWVISNQINAGIMNHLWYKEKFKDSYPISRKAVIPYIW